MRPTFLAGAMLAVLSPSLAGCCCCVPAGKQPPTDVVVGKPQPAQTNDQQAAPKAEADGKKPAPVTVAPPKIESKPLPEDAVAAKAALKAKRRDEWKESVDLRNANLVEQHKRSVARQEKEHATAVEAYRIAKEAYDKKLPIVAKAQAEYDAAKLLAAARTPPQATAALAQVYRKKQKAIVDKFPDTQAADDAKTLLGGGSVKRRPLPPEPDDLAAPKRPAALKLPEPPTPIALEYPPDPEEVAEANAKAEADAEAARQAKIAARGATRANYAKIKNGMTLAEVQDILGGGKEFASGGGTQVVTWERRGGLFSAPTIISITFSDNRVVAKAIVGN